MNDASARVMGVDSQRIVGMRVLDRFNDASIGLWLESSDQPYRTGAPASVENATSRWLRGDGTWGRRDVRVRSSAGARHHRQRQRNAMDLGDQLSPNSSIRGAS